MYPVKRERNQLLQKIQLLKKNCIHHIQRHNSGLFRIESEITDTDDNSKDFWEVDFTQDQAKANLYIKNKQRRTEVKTK